MFTLYYMIRAQILLFSRTHAHFPISRYLYFRYAFAKIMYQLTLNHISCFYLWFHTTYHEKSQMMLSPATALLPNFTFQLSYFMLLIIACMLEMATYARLPGFRRLIDGEAWPTKPAFQRHRPLICGQAYISPSVKMPLIDFRREIKNILPASLCSKYQGLLDDALRSNLSIRRLILFYFISW